MLILGCLRRSMALVPHNQSYGQHSHVYRKVVRFQWLSVLLLSLLPNLATADTGYGPVRGSFVHNDRTTLYAYDASPFHYRGTWFGDSRHEDPKPGLLVYFHGNIANSQESTLNTFFRESFKRLAWRHGLIPVVLASHSTQPLENRETGEEYEGRIWDKSKDTEMLRWLIYRELLDLHDGVDFDQNKVILLGSSGGSAFLSTLLKPPATDILPYRGLILDCGAQGFDFFSPPASHRESRVFIRASQGEWDFIQHNSISTFADLYNLGWNTLGDLFGGKSKDDGGGHCYPGTYSIDEAIGWILGTTRYKIPDGTHKKLGRMSRLVLSRSGSDLTYTENSISIKLHPDGYWRLEDEIVNTGHELVADGRKFILELSDDHVGDDAWRLAEYSISSVAGVGEVPSAAQSTQGSTGGLPLPVQVSGPTGVAVSADGSIYFADTGNHRVYRVAPSGAISSIGGTGQPGFSGDGGPATVAQLSSPVGVALHTDGAIYIADSGNARIRRIDPSGVITTIAGNGWPSGPAGNGGLATEASLALPYGVAVDDYGRVYFTDYGASVVRRIDLQGIITTIAGTGKIEDGETDGLPATESELIIPTGIAVCKNGDIYVGDSGNFRVRRIDGTMETVAILPNGQRFENGYFDPGFDKELADFQRYPPAYLGVACDSLGNIYISDKQVVLKRRPDSNATFGPNSYSVVAGRYTDPSQSQGDEDVPDIPLAGSARIRPAFLAVDGRGRIIFTDYVYNRLQILDPLEHLSSKYISDRIQRSYGYFDTSESHNSVEAGAKLSIQVGLDEYTPVPLDGILELEFVDSGGLAASGPQFSNGSRQIKFQIPAGSSVALFEGNQSTTDLLAGPAEGLVHLWFRFTAAGEGVDFPRERRNFRDIEIRAASATVPTGPAESPTRISLTLDLFVVSEASPLETITVQAEFDGGPRSQDTTINLTVRGSGVEAAVDFTPVQPFAITIPAGDTIGTATFDLRPVNDTEDERNESLTVIGSSNVGLQVGGARLTLADDDLGTYDGTNYVIRTVAGSTEVSDGIPAVTASLNSPRDVAVDALGNTYVADSENHRVRKIDPSGTISTLAGTGDWGFSGDGGPAAAAQLYRPHGLAVDAPGSVYVADTGNGRVRKIDASGTITTVAGTGEWDDGGDGGPAALAHLKEPVGVAVDADRNVYIADKNGHRVRKVDVSGTISTLAGTGERGFSGDGGPSTGASLYLPSDVAVDTAGNVYVIDTYNSRLRMIDAAGTITTVAGTGTSGFSGDGGPATSAELSRLATGVSTDQYGNVYIADYRNRRIRKIDEAGIISTIAGTGEVGSAEDGALANESQLNGPDQVATDSVGNVYFVERLANRVRKIDEASRTLSTVAGTGAWKDADDPTGSSTVKFKSPRGAAKTSAGDLLFIDDDRVWWVDLFGEVVLFAGERTSLNSHRKSGL